MKNSTALIFALALLLSACTTVKPYQKVFLNDSEMQLSNSDENFEKYIHSIREGATPASAAKSSGGCGCN